MSCNVALRTLGTKYKNRRMVIIYIFLGTIAGFHFKVSVRHTMIPSS